MSALAAPTLKRAGWVVPAPAADAPAPMEQEASSATRAIPRRRLFTRSRLPDRSLLESQVSGCLLCQTPSGITRRLSARNAARTRRADDRYDCSGRAGDGGEAGGVAAASPTRAVVPGQAEERLGLQVRQPD